MWPKITLVISLFYSLLFFFLILIYFSACRREKRFKKYFGFILGENKDISWESREVSTRIKSQAEKIQQLFQAAEKIQPTEELSSFLEIFSQIEEEFSAYRQMLKLARQNRFAIEGNFSELKKSFDKIFQEIISQCLQRESNFPRIETPDF